MEIKQTLELVKKSALKALKFFSLLGLAILVLRLPATSAFLSDGEFSENNTFASGTLAVDMRSGQSNFVSSPLAMEPNDLVARDIYVQKLGSLDMQYRSEFELLAGSDQDLCAALEVKVWHNWYDALPSSPGDQSTRQMDLKYQGSLSALTINHDFAAPNSYFNNIFYNENEDWFYYQVSLPATASATLQNKSCNFNIKTTAWQTDFLNESQGFFAETRLENTVATGEWAPEYLIVLNEFIPDPVGDDDELMPDGEWIELYNNGSADFDVAGWVLYDNNNDHDLIISLANSDNNSNHLDSGETVVPAGGRLVVYRHGESDFELNNDDLGDEIRLYTDQISSGGILIDTYSYSSALEGKSFARIPDGIGVWVDPIPTPGWENTNELGDLEPVVKLWQQNREYLQIGLLDALNYETAQIQVFYNRDEEGSFVQEVFDLNASIDRNNLYLKDLFMGSISGENKYLHYGIEEIQVKVILTGAGIPDRTINVNYGDDWIYD